MAHRPAEARAELLGIGQVLARLTPDFPDLTPSKLRFLEEQGLVAPARTASGYRKFDLDDIARLRTILTMQRDHYLPLKVIRRYLDDLDAGRAPLLPGASAPAPPSMLATGKRMKRDELIREAGATPELVQEAVSASLLAPAEVYGDDHLAIMRALVELQRVGIQPRHLRGFRAQAEREFGLIENAVRPLARRADASSRAQAREVAGEMAVHLDALRRTIVRAAIDRLAL